MTTTFARAAAMALAMTAGAATAGAQSHAHPPAPPAQGGQPAPKTHKPNRPKPENQPGAVMNAEKLAASHADHHEMDVLPGGGVMPEGWKHRFDLPQMKLEHVRLTLDGGDVHVTTGPPGIYYNTATTAAGSYVVSGVFAQLAKGEHREGYGPFIGGADLDGPSQRYLYFLVRQDGRFLVKERNGANTRGLVDWTPHKAIRTFAGDTPMSNELAIAVDADVVRFLINGTEVARRPRTGLPTDGIVGLRINHQLDVRVRELAVAPNGSR